MILTRLQIAIVGQNGSANVKLAIAGNPITAVTIVITAVTIVIIAVTIDEIIATTTVTIAKSG